MSSPRRLLGPARRLSGIEPAAWAPFARLVLEAAYEATLPAGLLNAARGASRKVFLRRLGGGAFGNDEAWIDAATLRALRLVADTDLAVSVVSYGTPSPAVASLPDRFAEARDAGARDGASSVNDAQPG